MNDDRLQMDEMLFHFAKLTHANRRMYFPAMLDDGNLHPVRFSIVSAAFRSFVWSVRVQKSFRQWSSHSSPLLNCWRCY